MGRRIIVCGTAAFWGTVGLVASVGWAANPPTAGQALGLRPMQPGVNYEIPASEVQGQCRVEPVAHGNIKGWAVRHPAGHLLRRFLDTNKDNVVDHWCYYREGLEVYRDIDSNANGKADQYRWLNQEGSRWGLDPDEDGIVDQWKVISAEEATAEAIRALAQKDFRILAPLLLSEADLKQLGLTRLLSQWREHATTAPRRFRKELEGSEMIDSRARWLRFDAAFPSRVPAESFGSSGDLTVYEHVLVVVETGDQTGLVYIGEMIQVGDTWRLVDVPRPQSGHQLQLPEGGWFVRSPLLDQRATDEPTTNPNLQKWLAKLQELDQQAGRDGDGPSRDYHIRRAEVLEQIAQSASAEQRGQWIRQMADTLLTAVQSEGNDEGLRRLGRLEGSLAQNGPADLAAYVTYRRMSAEYAMQIQAPKANLEKLQADWLKQLQEFIRRYPQSEDAPEAMLQIAVAQELSGNEAEARQWYTRLTQEVPQSAEARKAAGALRRLELEGKPLELQGATLNRSTLGIKDFRGQLLLVSFWATWCEPCKAELGDLQQIYARYRDKGFQILGVSLDSSAADLAHFLKQAGIAWPQIYEPGGMESRPATELGIVSLPSMILVDEKGNVISNGIHVAELETELQKRLGAPGTAEAPRTRR